MPSTTHINIDGVSIKTIEAKSRQDVNRVLQNFLSNTNNETKIIGLDTEWTKVDEEESKSNEKSKTAILQLCDESCCLIIKLLHLGYIPTTLFNFLRTPPDFIFVGIGIKENIAKLHEEYGVGCKNAVELGPLAAQVKGNPQLSACGIDELARGVDLLELEKPTCVIFKDWNSNCLNKKQVKWATVNAYAYFRIGSKLLDTP